MCERFYNFPVPNRIAASAPTRIDLAGGTIDIWPLYLSHDGACTVNAAISLRAHATIEPRTDGRVGLQSIDTNKQVEAARWQDLRPEGELPLLALLARHYGLANATLITRGESPAGAGIAGSSALAIAVCGALARWSGGSMDEELMLQTAMNIECQTIKVPTGVQDYRPALYGGIAAIELRTDVHPPRPHRRRASRSRTTHRPRLHRRAAQLRHEQLGDHQAPHRRRPAHLRLLRADS